MPQVQASGAAAAAAQRVRGRGRGGLAAFAVPPPLPLSCGAGGWQGRSSAAIAAPRHTNANSSISSSGRRTLPRARAAELMPLGLDFLTFLAATVAVVPVCKRFKVSPVLGFLATGFVLQQLGAIKDREDMERLSELGGAQKRGAGGVPGRGVDFHRARSTSLPPPLTHTVLHTTTTTQHQYKNRTVLFLLFEMGLELSLDRLKSLAKFAFGMGSLQVLITGLVFVGFALPAGSSLGTRFLEAVCGAPPSLVSIRSLDEAVVIAAALSMSSSAFVLQLLSERGETPTRFGSATLGILLFQVRWL
jgi:hypothetical protein